MNRFLILMVMLCSVRLMAADITWLRLKTDFTYRDLKKECSSFALGSELYFAAQIEGDRLVQAVLNKSLNSSNPKYRYVFSDEELKEIVLFKDAHGYFWLNELPLLSAAVAWVVTYVGEYCSPSQPIKTVEPSVGRFHFDTDGLGEEIVMSASNQLTFTGTLADERNLNADSWYKATLKFTESYWGRK